MMEPTGRMVFSFLGFPAPNRTEPDRTGNWKKRTLCSCRIVPSKQQQQQKKCTFLTTQYEHNKNNNKNIISIIIIIVTSVAHNDRFVFPLFLLFFYFTLFFFGIVDATRAEINCDFAITTTTMK